MHDLLLDSVRGQDKGRGRFRTLQNWIGKPGTPMKQARFVPPSPLHLQDALNEFEKYIHYDEEDVLVQLAIVHAQFEILHPFLDGNGRIGRILIPLFLYEKKILGQPMFYISSYLESNRPEYYDKLKAISDENQWEEWISFFLGAIEIQAKKNIDKARAILALYEKLKADIVGHTHSQFSIQSLDCLFNLPIFSTSDFEKHSKIPRASVGRIIKQLNEAEIIEMLEKGSGRKPSVYIFRKLIDIVNRNE